VDAFGVQGIPGHEAYVEIATLCVRVDDNGWAVLELHDPLRQAVPMQNHFEEEPS
jgi:hypothetical protein